MNKAAIVQSIENVRIVYKKELQASNVSVAEDEISWRAYNPGIFSNIPYLKEYRTLLDAQQYSFLFLDNSFAQIYYNFDVKGVLLKAKLAYYPPPQNTKITVDELYEDFNDANEWLIESLIEQAQDMDGEERLINTSHVRFDFDSSVKSHYKAHLQFGGANDFRMGSEKIPLPFSFIDLMVNCFDPNARSSKVETGKYKEAASFDKRRFFHSDEKNKEALFITCVD